MVKRDGIEQGGGTLVGGLQASAEVWAELTRSLGIDGVARLLRTPILLKAALMAAEERLRESAA